MKRVFRNRLLLLLLFFIACGLLCTAHAVCGLVSQGQWRWRNDDGSETSATWKAAQRTPIVYSAGSVLRLRIEVINTRRQSLPGGTCGSPIAIDLKDTLQYSTTPATPDSWVTIDNATNKAFVLAGVSSINVVQDDPTTPQLTSTSSNAFSPGKMMAGLVSLNHTIPESARSEFEWVIRGTANMVAGIIYYFRLKGTVGYVVNVNNPPTVYYSYLTTAVNSPLPVKLSNFSVKKEGGKVRIAWTTATEQASDHFELLRSADGQSWQAIAQVQSRGNTTAATAYFAYDNLPLSGLNYYRLQQVDKDGKSAFSTIKSLRLSKDVAVSVWPNPTVSDINFSLQEAAVKVVTTLQDVAGRTVHQQTFVNLPAGAVNTLATAQKLAAGIYILKLEADGFSETRKVFVQ